MLYTMSNQAIAANIPVHERMEALALIHADGRCHGAIVRNLMTGELLAYVARATCIATGGFGRIYRVSTNAVINEGMGAAIALETGVATLGNMEAIQFHPTGIFPAGILVTEGCRGDGGLLLDRNEHRFMPDYEPEKKELASRDVVSRRMEEHIAAGHGVKSRFGEHLWLDIRLLGAEHINNNLREVKEICQYFLGVDPVHELIPVRPAQHYSMGGVRTDHRGESPQLRGLFAAGEAACWDMHGFNRLGGNSVAETVVAGMIVGDTMADFCDSSRGRARRYPAHWWRNSAAPSDNRLAGIANGRGRESAFELARLMQETMTAKVGIFRHGDRLRAGGGHPAGTATAQPQYRPAQQCPRGKPGTRYRLPRAAHAEARPVRGLWRPAAHREPRRPLPRRLSPAGRPQLDAPHPRQLARTGCHGCRHWITNRWIS